MEVSPSVASCWLALNVFELANYFYFICEPLLLALPVLLPWIPGKLV